MTLTYGASARTPAEYKKTMMSELPVGAAVVLEDGTKGTILFHTVDMRGYATGLRVQFEDGAYDDVAYDAVLAIK